MTLLRKKLNERRAGWMLACFTIVLMLATVLLHAQEETPAAGDLPRERASAAATLRTFLTAFPNRHQGRPDRIIPNAIDCMDFSGALSLLTEGQKRDLAIDLKSVIDRTVFVDYDKVSREAGDSDRYVLARLNSGFIALERKSEGWLFSTDTIQSLSELMREVSRRAVIDGIEDVQSLHRRSWIRDRMPEVFHRQGFVLEYWQWLALLLLIMVGVLLDHATRFVAAGLVRRALKARGFDVGEEKIRVYLRPVGLLAMAILWATQIGPLMLPPTIAAVLTVAVKFIAGVSFVWFAYEGVDAGRRILMRRAVERDDKFQEAIIGFISRVAKIFIVAFGFVFVAHNVGVNVASLLAGLGLGGLAFALAAKDTVENLFGSITVLVDRPFRVGDWITIDGKIDGTVESLGLRSTRVRTFYNSLITVPNSMLIRQPVDNYGARRYRRWRTIIKVTYDTPPEKIEAFCEGIRELVRRHPWTRKDYYHIYGTDFGPHSLDILVYVFFDTPDWGTELRERHRLFLDIVRLAKDLGVEFAFPTQTLHIVGEVPPHEDTPPGRISALRTGRRAASSIIRAQFGDQVVKPPPVRIDAPEDIPEEELRAERSGGQ